MSVARRSQGTRESKYLLWFEGFSIYAQISSVLDPIHALQDEGFQLEPKHLHDSVYTDTK